jgi:hypothetical protein
MESKKLLSKEELIKRKKLLLELKQKQEKVKKLKIEQVHKKPVAQESSEEEEALDESE